LSIALQVVIDAVSVKIATPTAAVASAAAAASQNNTRTGHLLKQATVELQRSLSNGDAVLPLERTLFANWSTSATC